MTDPTNDRKQPDRSEEEVDIFDRLSTALEEFGTTEPPGPVSGTKQEARAIVVTKLT
jgi:hypothetical protein